MTVDEVKAAVEAIRKVADDDEKAHGKEDALHQKVLQAIAEGQCDDPVACAAAALLTRGIRFRRWCA